MRIEASVTDESGEVHHGWAETRLTRPEVKLRFLGPRTLSRDLPYEVIVTAHEQDDSMLSKESLGRSKLVVETLVQLSNGTILMSSLHEKRREPGLAAWKHTSSLAEQLRHLEKQVDSRQVVGIVLDASFADGRRRASARIHLRTVEMEERLAISCSTRNPTVGQNIVFHVRTSRPVASLSYLLVARGRVFASSELAMDPHTVRTFHLPVQQEMAPSATLLVYFPGNPSDVQTLTFPVAWVSFFGRGFHCLTHKEPAAFRELLSAKKFPALIREFWIVGGWTLFGHTCQTLLLLLQKIHRHRDTVTQTPRQNYTDTNTQIDTQ